MFLWNSSCPRIVLLTVLSTGQSSALLSWNTRSRGQSLCFPSNAQGLRRCQAQVGPPRRFGAWELSCGSGIAPQGTKNVGYFSAWLNNSFINHQQIAYGTAYNKHVTTVKLQLLKQHAPDFSFKMLQRWCRRENADICNDLIWRGSGFCLIFFLTNLWGFYTAVPSRTPGGEELGNPQGFFFKDLFWDSSKLRFCLIFANAFPSSSLLQQPAEIALHIHYASSL